MKVLDGIYRSHIPDANFQRFIENHAFDEWSEIRTLSRKLRAEFYMFFYSNVILIQGHLLAI